jgi:DNA-binding ferritin-like protein
MFEEIDTLTEHMRYLGMKPVSTLSRVIEVSGIEEASSSVNADGMVSNLLDSNKKLIEMLVTISEEADAQKQYATSNLVQGIMETHGKFVWMLRSISE